MFRLHLAKQLFSSIAKPGAKCHCSWSKPDKIPTHSTPTVTKPKQMSRLLSLSSRVVRLAPKTFQNQIKQRAMKIVTNFKITRNENCAPNWLLTTMLLMAVLKFVTICLHVVLKPVKISSHMACLDFVMYLVQPLNKVVRL